MCISQTAHCREYEEAIVGAGGIDVQLLGIGRSGHIGLNEPGAGEESRTRLIVLDEVTRKEIDRFLDTKHPGQPDSQRILDVKSQIRRSEAISAIESVGLSEDRAHFLDLPFYRTGQVRKLPVGQADMDLVLALLERWKPDVICLAGDMSDPHGTHRMCLSAIDGALEAMGHAPERWYYRGAWQEWSVAQADIFVPLSRAELNLKIQAIFKHQSQKDTAMFPGSHDEREFWQRVENRNRQTADTMNRLGLPEYHAMEAFVIVPASG